MSVALANSDEILRIGINHHMWGRATARDKDLDVFKDSKIQIRPQDLFFNEHNAQKRPIIQKMPDDCSQEDKYVKIFSKLKSRRSMGQEFSIYVKMLTGITYTLSVHPDNRVDELKIKIRDKVGIPPDAQHLIFAGRQLLDEQRLGKCNIHSESIVYLVLSLEGGGFSSYELDQDYYDPRFNYDFRNITADEVTFYRGGHIYTRPLGSMRYALNVLGLYGEDYWLGVNYKRSVRTASVDNEWPVAYHGTADPRIGEIVTSGGLKLEKGVRFQYGFGIYCTPDPKTALAYATPYVHEESTYKLIVQTRVDPERRVIVPKETHRIEGLDDYWIAKEDDAIRPYGICIYPC